jgi:hypothetical protein
VEPRRSGNAPLEFSSPSALVALPEGVQPQPHPEPHPHPQPAPAQHDDVAGVGGAGLAPPCESPAFGMMFEAGDDAGSAEVYGQLLQSQANPDESDIVDLRYSKLGLADCTFEDSGSRRRRDRGTDLLCTSARVAGAHSIPKQGVRRIGNKRTVLMERCRTAVGPCHVQLDAPEATDPAGMNGSHPHRDVPKNAFPFHSIASGGVVRDGNRRIE